VAVVIIALLALSGCSDDESPAAAPPPASSSVPAAPGSSTGTTESGGFEQPEIATNPDGTVNSGGPRPATSESALTAGGFGPYKIGVAQRELASAGLIGKVTAETSENCAGYATAKGTGRYHSPALVFFKGRLLRLTMTSERVATDRDVEIGTALAAVKDKYPGGKQIDDWTGRAAWLATTGDYGLLFQMRNAKVSAMQAGMTEPMQFKYTDGQGC
jgi:hypothetical protein